LEQNWLWGPWRAPRRVFARRFVGAACLRYAIEDRLYGGLAILRAR
jgi:hypothetical protein